MKIQLEILGKPMGKQRPRLGKFGTYTPKDTVNYENLIKLAFMNKYKNFTPIEMPIKATIKAYFMPPASISNKKRVELVGKRMFYPKKSDIDNICKIVLDGLNKIAYLDDKQIVQLEAEKRYSDKDYIYVELEELEG